MTDFTFTPTIPATNNNPSDDQPLMLVNNQSTNDILDVDHIGFNQNNGGMHKAIHFDQSFSYVPAPPVSPPALFTNTFAGLPQLFWYSGANTASSLQYSAAAAANFSTFLFGGLILKGGSFAAGSGATVVDYTTIAPALAAFPNNTLAVIVTPKTTGSIAGYFVDTFTATSFKFNTGVTISTTYNFIAIGY